MLCGVSLLMMTALTSTSAWTFLIVPFILGGAGIGLVNPPLASTAIGVVPHERSGMASGINATFRQVGIATGIAGLGAIFQHEILTLHDLGAAHARGGRRDDPRSAGGRARPARAGAQLGLPRRPAGLDRRAAARTTLSHAYRIGFVDAFTTIAAVAAAIALIGSVAAFVLVRSKDFVASHAPSEAPEGEPVMSAAG